MTKTFTKIALAAAAVGAVSLPAAGALAATQTESAIIGAILGGVGGAAVSHGKTQGVVLGAVAGAAIGAAVDSNDHRRYDTRHRYVHREARPYYGDTRYGYDYGRRPTYQGYARGYDRDGYGSSYGYGDGGYGYRR